MKRLGRAHEDVVAAMLCVQSELAESLFEVGDDLISVLFRRDALKLSVALNIDSVLVGSRQKVGLVSALTVVASQAISDNRRIETAQMREAVCVIDWSCDVKSFHRCTSDR